MKQVIELKSGKSESEEFKWYIEAVPIEGTRHGAALYSIDSFRLPFTYLMRIFSETPFAPRLQELSESTDKGQYVTFTIDEDEDEDNKPLNLHLLDIFLNNTDGEYIFDDHINKYTAAEITLFSTRVDTEVLDSFFDDAIIDEMFDGSCYYLASLYDSLFFRESEISFDDILIEFIDSVMTKYLKTEIGDSDNFVKYHMQDLIMKMTDVDVYKSFFLILALLHQPEDLKDKKLLIIQNMNFDFFELLTRLFDRESMRRKFEKSCTTIFDEATIKNLLMNKDNTEKLFSFIFKIENGEVRRTLMTRLFTSMLSEEGLVIDNKDFKEFRKSFNKKLDFDSSVKTDEKEKMLRKYYLLRKLLPRCVNEDAISLLVRNFLQPSDLLVMKALIADIEYWIEPTIRTYIADELNRLHAHAMERKLAIIPEGISVKTSSRDSAFNLEYILQISEVGSATSKVIINSSDLLRVLSDSTHDDATRKKLQSYLEKNRTIEFTYDKGVSAIRKALEKAAQTFSSHQFIYIPESARADYVFNKLLLEFLDKLLKTQAFQDYSPTTHRTSDEPDSAPRHRGTRDTRDRTAEVRSALAEKDEKRILQQRDKEAKRKALQVKSAKPRAPSAPQPASGSTMAVTRRETKSPSILKNMTLDESTRFSADLRLFKEIATKQPKDNDDFAALSMLLIQFIELRVDHSNKDDSLVRYLESIRNMLVHGNREQISTFFNSQEFINIFNNIDNINSLTPMSSFKAESQNIKRHDTWIQLTSEYCQSAIRCKESNIPACWYYIGRVYEQIKIAKTNGVFEKNRIYFQNLQEIMAEIRNPIFHSDFRFDYRNMEEFFGTVTQLASNLSAVQKGQPTARYQRDHRSTPSSREPGSAASAATARAAGVPGYGSQAEPR